MARVDLYDMAGKKTGKVELPNKLFVGKINQILMAQAVRVYLANRRAGSAKAKGRSEITSLSTAKIWRQKGTGRARHSSRRAPIFVGGGKAHGPTGKQNYSLKLSKKMKQAALISALTLKHKDKTVWVIKDLENIKEKTKLGLKTLKVILKDKVEQKIGLVLSGKPGKTVRSFRNLRQVDLYSSAGLNTYSTLRADQLVFTKQSLEDLRKRFEKEKKEK